MLLFWFFLCRTDLLHKRLFWYHITILYISKIWNNQYRKPLLVKTEIMFFGNYIIMKLLKIIFQTLTRIVILCHWIEGQVLLAQFWLSWHWRPKLKVIDLDLKQVGYILTHAQIMYKKIFLTIARIWKLNSIGRKFYILPYQVKNGNNTLKVSLSVSI